VQADALVTACNSRKRDRLLRDRLRKRLGDLLSTRRPPTSRWVGTPSMTSLTKSWNRHPWTSTTGYAANWDWTR